jgi:hypothetical protein
VGAAFSCIMAASLCTFFSYILAAFSCLTAAILFLQFANEYELVSSKWLLTTILFCIAALSHYTLHIEYIYGLLSRVSFDAILFL